MHAPGECSRGLADRQQSPRDSHQVDCARARELAVRGLAARRATRGSGDEPAPVSQAERPRPARLPARRAGALADTAGEQDRGAAATSVVTGLATSVCAGKVEWPDGYTTMATRPILPVPAPMTVWLPPTPTVARAAVPMPPARKKTVMCFHTKGSTSLLMRRYRALQSGSMRRPIGPPVLAEYTSGFRGLAGQAGLPLHPPRT